MATTVNPYPLVVIAGETASGKSALAMELARQFNGEIISADAWTVYQHFDIGTAKPTIKERREIPHHLIDIAKASDGFSAAIFKRKAQDAISDIACMGKLPILAGGTGLYIDSILYDYEFMPAPEPTVRDRLNAMTIPELLDEAHGRGIDTSGIDKRNKRRIIRLIENEGALPERSSLRKNTLVLGVTIPKEQLEQRIMQRVDTMIEAGLELEVKVLAELYGWEVEPMKGIGYREFREYFEGTQTLQQTNDRIISGTLRLAKKQRTWFRRNESIQWVSEQKQAVDLLTAFLNKYHI
jgi:tRNA dimethylallyltransferase